MSRTVPNAFARPAPTAVTTDVPCRKCQYNLRGLNTDARCPECGIAVAASVSEDLLRFCDPAWVMSLAHGAKLIIAGFLLLFLNIILYISLLLTVGRANAIYEVAIVQFLSNVLAVVGSWLVTTPDPSGLGEDRYGTDRKIIRITLIIGATERLFTVAIKVLPNLPVSPQIIATIQGLGGTIVAAGLYFQLRYFEEFARRIPQPVLTIRAKYFKNRFPAWYFAAIAASTALRLNSGNFQRGGRIYIDGGLALLELVTLGLAIAYLRLIASFAASFKQQAILAADSWATHAADPAPQ